MKDFETTELTKVLKSSSEFKASVVMIGESIHKTVENR